MPAPDLAIIAEGDLPTGEHWILKAGGTTTDFYTFLETVHPDGHRDEGGMGGPLLPGGLMNTYTGGSERGLRRVLARTDPRVARVRVRMADGEQIELLPLAARPDVNLVFFATLLPRTTVLRSITAADSDGRELQPQDLSAHEAAWQLFQRRLGNPNS